MKTETANALVVELIWQGKALLDLRKMGVKRRVETANLRHAWPVRLKAPHTVQVVWLVQRCQCVERGQLPVIRGDDDHFMAERFEFLPDAEIAIESDPRTLTDAMVKKIGEIGFTRASFGVQEFDPKVQKAINRIQPPEMVENAMDRFRSVGVNKLNFDLIYGLPYQTSADLRRTVEQCVEMRPDRVALFGYAHVPWMKPHQRLLEPAGLPGASQRLALCGGGDAARCLARFPLVLASANAKATSRAWNVRDIDPMTGRFAQPGAKGAVRVSSTSITGKQITLTYVEPGTWFGDIALFDGLPRTHDSHGTFQQWLERVHPDDRALTEQSTNDVLAGRAHRPVEFRVVHPDGQIRHLLMHAHLERNEAGVPAVVASGQGEKARTRLQSACAGCDQSSTPSSFVRRGA